MPDVIHKSTVMIGVRLSPAAVSILKHRAQHQGRTFNEYMRFLLEDQAFRDHDRARTERRRRKLAKEVQR